MESSDDDTLSERSCVSEPSFRSERSGGSLSPCPSVPGGLPGDTLPWNLSKHERRKRKSQDSVLDPAERAVVRVAGKRETTNKAWNCGMETVAGLFWKLPAGTLCPTFGPHSGVEEHFLHCSYCGFSLKTLYVTSVIQITYQLNRPGLSPSLTVTAS